MTNKIYVPNSFSNTVSVIDGTTNAATTITTGIGTDPNDVAINPVTNKIYVTNLADGTVSVIDGATNTVTDRDSWLQFSNKPHLHRGRSGDEQNLCHQFFY